MIEADRKAPEFDLESTEGRRVSLRQFRGQTVVVYFYPRDMTPACTKEACGFRDARAQFKKRGVVVLGISPDSTASHAKFRDTHELDFPLLSDPDKAVASRYGVFGEKTLYGRKVVGMIRSTFVIDGAGIVRKVFPRVRVEGHAVQVLQAIDAL